MRECEKYKYRGKKGNIGKFCWKFLSLYSEKYSIGLRKIEKFKTQEKIQNIGKTVENRTICNDTGNQNIFIWE